MDSKNDLKGDRIAYREKDSCLHICLYLPLVIVYKGGKKYEKE